MVDYIPRYFKSLDRKAWEFTCVTIIIAIGITLSLKYTHLVRQDYVYPIKSEFGTIYTLKKFSTPFNQAAEYINKNFSKEAKFLVIPKGIILNLLTHKHSDNRYYQLFPVDVEVFGEDKIIADLKKNPPDYILVNNRNIIDWGYEQFGAGYGQKIDKYIMKNYKFEKVFGSKDFWIAIFKKKA